METSREFAFTLGYFVVSACLIVPPREFVSLGFTVQNLFSSYLGVEDLHFVTFHMKRTAVTILFHSLLPLGNIISLFFLSVHSIFSHENVSDRAILYFFRRLLCLFRICVTSSSII